MAQTAKIISTPIWSRITIPSVVPNAGLKFFTVPQGQLDPNNQPYGGLAVVDTSLQTAQRLGEPESFDIHSLQLWFDPGTLEADIVKLQLAGWVNLWTGNGQVLSLQVPLMLIPAAIGFPFSSANTVHAQNGYPSPGADYRLRQIIMWGINENVYAELNFNGAASLSANVRATLLLSGDHYMVDVKDPVTGLSTRRSV